MARKNEKLNALRRIKLRQHILNHVKYRHFVDETIEDMSMAELKRQCESYDIMMPIT